MEGSVEQGLTAGPGGNVCSPWVGLPVQCSRVTHRPSPLLHALSSHLTLCFLKASSWGRGLLPPGPSVSTPPQGDRAPSLAPPKSDNKPTALSCSEPALGWALDPPHADCVPGPGLGWETPGFMVQGPGVRTVAEIALRHVV